MEGVNLKMKLYKSKMEDRRKKSEGATEVVLLQDRTDIYK